MDKSSNVKNTDRHRIMQHKVSLIFTDCIFKNTLIFSQIQELNGSIKQNGMQGLAKSIPNHKSIQIKKLKTST